MKKLLVVLVSLFSINAFAGGVSCDTQKNIATHTLFNMVAYEHPEPTSNAETKSRLCAVKDQSCQSMVDVISQDMYANRGFYLKANAQKGFGIFSKEVESKMKCM